MNKRGVSEIVTFVLIILLVIIAVGIVWRVVLPLVQQPAEELTTSCLTIQLSIEEASYEAIVDDAGTPDDETDDVTTYNLSVKIKRGAGEGEFGKIAIIVDGEKYEVDSLEIEELETKTYEVDNLSEIPEKIEISSIITEGESEKTCEIQDQTTNIAKVTVTE